MKPTTRREAQGLEKIAYDRIREAIEVEAYAWEQFQIVFEALRVARQELAESQHDLRVAADVRRGFPKQ